MQVRSQMQSINNTFVAQHICVKELSGEVWGYSSKLMCFLNGLLLGNEKDLCSWAKTKWDFSFSQPEDFYMALSQDYYSTHLRNTGASQSNLSSMKLFFSSTTTKLFLKTNSYVWDKETVRDLLLLCAVKLHSMQQKTQNTYRTRWCQTTTALQVLLNFAAVQ